MSARLKAVPDASRELYRELVLRHAREPRNFGRLPAASHSAEGANTLCGDRLALYLEVSAEGRIDAIRFDGTGCAISLASASLMTQAVAQRPVADALSLSARFCTALNTGGELGEQPLAALGAVRRYPSRVRCATLAWQTLERALASPRLCPGTAGAAATE